MHRTLINGSEIKLGFTNLALQMGARDPSEGGNFIKDVIQGKRDSDQGKLVWARGIQPW
jgi:hypothetical protein